MKIKIHLEPKEIELINDSLNEKFIEMQTLKNSHPKSKIILEKFKDVENLKRNFNKIMDFVK